MTRHGSNKLIRVTAAALLATLISGCQAVQHGSPHPFTTLFHADEPAYRIESSDATVILPVSCQQQAR
ncbi:MAG: hypothetical protein RIK87_16120 [Fuerstiella sp.]